MLKELFHLSLTYWTEGVFIVNNNILIVIFPLYVKLIKHLASAGKIQQSKRCYLPKHILRSFVAVENEDLAAFSQSFSIKDRPFEPSQCRTTTMTWIDSTYFSHIESSEEDPYRAIARPKLTHVHKTTLRAWMSSPIRKSLKLSICRDFETLLQPSVLHRKVRCWAASHWHSVLYLSCCSSRDQGSQQLGCLCVRLVLMMIPMRKKPENLPMEARSHLVMLSRLGQCG